MTMLAIAGAGALMLGVRHGLDADHLAAIDGMTRLNALAKRRFARYCGVLFAFGHGLVLLAVANLVGTFALDWQPPSWLTLGGALISILVVGMLGVLNLRAVLTAAPGSMVRPVGLKARMFRSTMVASRPWSVALTGALFALSFDTFGLASFFAVAAASNGGAAGVLLLGGLFTLGMILLDGINGLWLAGLLARSDRRAAMASRLMGIGVSVVSLLVAALGVVSLLAPRATPFMDDNGLLISGILLVAMLVCFWAGRLFRTDL